jgi:FtsH-binding integral membrane protein
LAGSTLLEYNPEEYIAAALQLYVDIIFLLLILFGGSGGSN